MATATRATLAVVASPTEPADDSAYDALTHVLVGQVASIGPLGDTVEAVPVTTLADGRTTRVPGPIDGGEIPVMIATNDSSDAGQTLLRTNSNTSNGISFKITDPDSTIRYFWGLVADYTESERSPSVNQGASFTIYRNSPVLVS